MKSFAEFIDESKSGDSSLRDWFSKSSSDDGTPGWVQLGGKYAGKPCARQPGQKTKPKCGSSKMKRNLSKDEEEKAFRRKNREDGNPDRRGKAKNVATEAAIDPRNRPVSGGGMLGIQSRQSLRDARNKNFQNKLTGVSQEIKTKLNQLDKNPPKVTTGSVRIRADIPEETFLEKAGEKDACYKKVKSRYRVWPSAYASGALVKCRKVGAANWGNKTKKEDFSPKATALVERYTKLQERGKTYHVRFQWRGKYEGIQMFFPSLTTPTKMEVSAQIEKIYPGATVISFGPHFRDPTQPLLHVGEDNP